MITGDLFIDDFDTLTITEDMPLVVQDDVHIQGILKIDDGKQLKLYIGDDLTVHHDGKIENFYGDLGNVGAPCNLSIYSTDTGTLDPYYRLGGITALYAGIYGPRAVIDMEAGDTMYGAIIANEVNFNSDYDFNYDENLISVIGDNPTYTSDFARNY